jgi:hypothetical protein
MHRLLILAIVVTGFCSTPINAQPVDVCQYIAPDSISSEYPRGWNPDSVAKDTCEGSSTYLEYYSKRYNVDFRVDAFHLGYGQPDSVIIVNWTDIDPSYPGLRDSFESISRKWGAFSFQKIDPADTSHSIESFKLVFEDYLPVAPVLLDLYEIWTDGWIEARVRYPTPAPNQKVLVERGNRLEMSVKDDILHCRIPANIPGPVVVQIFDPLGRNRMTTSHEIGQTHTLEIPISALPIGRYFVQIEKVGQGSFIKM